MKETNGQTLSKQQQKSLETKNRIFSAAKSILQRKGYDALSIKNICEEAGVSNGSFYHHFKTKDDLLSYYIEEQPTIDPDCLELPENAAEAKRAIILVYLNYVSYCKELGVAFISNYYTPKKPGSKSGHPHKAALSDRNSKRITWLVHWKPALYLPACPWMRSPPISG